MAVFRNNLKSNILSSWIVNGGDDWLLFLDETLIELVSNKNRQYALDVSISEFCKTFMKL